VGLHATTYNAYALLMQDLAALQKRAAEYWVNAQQSVPVWLTCKLDGETTGRQALVKAIHFEFRPWPNGLNPIYQECPGSVSPNLLLGTLLIERHPYWERTAVRQFPNQAEILGQAAVPYDYTSTADIVGDVPARVDSFDLKVESGAGNLTRFWLGIRSATLHGATGMTNFIDTWEAEDGTEGTDVTVDAASEVNTASPGNGSGSFVTVAEVAVDWDDGTFYTVESWTLTNVGYGTASDGFGRFLWLLRAKVATGSTWQAQLRVGYAGSYITLDTVQIVEDNWQYFELGIGSLPPRDLQTITTTVIGVADDANLYVALMARRTAGAGNFKVDCICPIPIDEGFLKIPAGYANTTHHTGIAQSPKDTAQAFVISNIGIYSLPTFEVENFRLPPGDGRIICVYARASETVLTDIIEFCEPSEAALNYTERWTALRGAE